MLKKRIAALLIILDGVVVQSIGFKKYLPVGRPDIAIEFLNEWGVDEIILLDIRAGINGNGPDYSMVKEASKSCRVPLTIGGGIKNIVEVDELMSCGADKVAFNHAAIYKPQLLTEVARRFGSQAVVASIDGKALNDNYYVYDYQSKEITKKEPTNLAYELQGYGAGEILINSVDRDGSYLGYDQNLIQSVCEKVSIPVICCGGAGNAKHFVDVFKKTNASAAAASNILHFTEHSVATIKASIKKHTPIRNEVNFSYKDSSFDVRGRLLKKEEAELERLLYAKIEKEII